MIQIRAGDLIEVEYDRCQYRFAILTRQILFGGHWCFVYHPGGSPANGFNAFVDFLVPKRQGRVVVVSRGNDFTPLAGPNLLKQQPQRAGSTYRILTWRDLSVDSVKLLRATERPSQEELSAPEYACLKADSACELAARRWLPSQAMWPA